MSSFAPSPPSPSVDPAKASRAARCELARRNLIDFCGLIEIPGAPVGDEETTETFKPIEQPPAAHHRLIIDVLQKVERGEIKRAMFFLPPGSAKSTYVSVVFPPYFMAKDTRRNAIVATYASPLARKLGRRARSIVRQPIFQEIFGCGLASDTAAADEWALTTGQEFMSGGVMSGITGNRADLLIIDDPIKGREEAESETIRKRTREEYEDSLKTRLKPGGRIVIVQTRWHQDDLAGGILPTDYDGESGWVTGQDGEQWYVVCIPAQANRADDPLKRPLGGYLWPEWFGADHWASFKGNARTWSALFQQRPQPDEGTYFLRASFKRFHERDLPTSLRYYGTSDYAVTDGGGDFTRLRIWAVDAAQPPNVYLVDGWGGQTSSDQWVEQQIDLISRHRPQAWYGEAGVIQKAIEPIMTKRMRERRVSCRMVWLPSIADKPTRARAAQAMVQEGRVHIREDHDGDCFIDECAAFPAGKYDDDVDNLSLMGRAIDQIMGPRLVAAKPNPKLARPATGGTAWMT